MVTSLLSAILIAAACTGPYCGPDADFERPTGSVLGVSAAPAVDIGPDGALFLVWEQRAFGEADILFNRREPGPAGSWGAPVRLDTDAAGAARSLEPRVAAGPGDWIHVVWQDARDGKDDLRYRRSSDGGRSWIATDERLGSGLAGEAVSAMPALAADGVGRVWVAWEEQQDGLRDIRLRVSSDHGETWGPELRADSDAPGSGTSYHPQLVVWDDGTALVIWWDERDGAADLYVRRSLAAGGTWDGPERRLDPGEAGAGASRDARVSVSGDVVAVAWEEAEGAGRSQIATGTSPDRGTTWETPRTKGLGVDPVPVHVAGETMVVWIDGPVGGAREKTSIGGRVREIPRPVGLEATGGEGRGARQLSSLEGPSAIWAGASRGGGAADQRAWAVRTGSSIGRGVVEIFRGTREVDSQGARGAGETASIGVRWRRHRTVLFGESLQATSVPVTALGPVGVASGSALHVIWVARTGEIDDLGHVRIDP